MLCDNAMLRINSRSEQPRGWGRSTEYAICPAALVLPHCKAIGRWSLPCQRGWGVCQTPPPFQSPLLGYGRSTLYRAVSANEHRWPRENVKNVPIVFSLWATVSTVQCANFVLIVFCIRASVWGSTFAVASSSIKIRLFLNIALAKHTSCRWPTL